MAYPIHLSLDSFGLIECLRLNSELFLRVERLKLHSNCAEPVKLSSHQFGFVIFFILYGQCFVHLKLSDHILSFGI